MANSSDKFKQLLDIIKSLRAPDGCPWDKKQTPESFKPYLLEETHELIEAIDKKEDNHIKEEIGDLYFQLGFLSTLYSEQQKFDIEDSLDAIISKMIRRHPHVFTDEKFSSAEEIKKNWQKIKDKERKSKHEVKSIDVPKTLPSLVRAQRVSNRAAAHGFEWPDNPTMMAKFDEEVNELKEAVAKDNNEKIADELGDVFFMLINICRRFELSSEDIMHNSTSKFIKRFTLMESLLIEDNLEITTSSAEQHLQYWQLAKEKISTD